MNMKSLSAALLAGFIGLSVHAANWVYDSSAKTISDTVWTFNASANGASLTVNACTGWPTAVTALDFTKEISDGSQTYTIVTLNPQFGHKVDNWGNLDSAVAYEYAQYVGELTLPGNGLTKIGEAAFLGCVNATGTVTLPSTLETIGNWAFCKCTSLTEVTPVLPDSVTTLGIWTFHKVAIPDDVRLENVSRVDTGVFKDQTMKSVYFGAGLKMICSSGWDRGPFRNCANMTNVVFSSAITNAEFGGTHQFHECPNITCDLDLSRFKKLSSTWGSFTSASKVKKVIIGPFINEITSAFFSGLSGVTNMTFMGKPPKTFGTPLYSGFGKTQEATTYIPVAYSNEWSVYAADGVINGYASTFSETYFSAEVIPYRMLLFADAGGGGGGELGDAVFDKSTGILTMPNGWQFSATVMGASLTVGSCVAAPDDVSPLDFSVSITDTTGRPLKILYIDTKFASIAYTDGNPPTFVFTPALGAHKVGKLTLPTNNITKISAYAFADCEYLTGPLKIPASVTTIEDAAFANCTSLTEIVNFIPDTVTAVKKWAFLRVPVKGQLRLASITQAGALAFMASGMESIYFGPSFTGFSSYNWNVSPYRDMKALTNVTFDAAIKNAKWHSQHVFMSCSNIEGLLDLSGFSEVIVDWGMITTGSKIKEVVFGEDLTKLHGKAFQGMSGLTNVIFKGVPPNTFNDIYLYGLSKTQKVTTLVSWKKCRQTNASGVSWFDYAENGQINRTRSTWIASKVASGIDLANRPLIAPDANIGLKVILR